MPTATTKDNLVTVIMPAYNAASYVLDAIESIRQQHYEPIEILLVDDGSTDNTVELVKSHAPEVVIIRQANAGASAARNTGLRQANGNYICFLDADDGWFDGKLAAQVDYLQRHPEVGIAYHNWLVWKPEADGRFITPLLPQVTSASEIDAELSGWIYGKLLLDCIVHTSTVMLRRKAREEIGLFDTTLETGEDYDYWLRVARKYEIHKLSKIYSFYRSTPGSLTNKPQKNNNEYHLILNSLNKLGWPNANTPAIQPSIIKKRLGKLAFDFGYTHFHSGDTKIAMREFTRSLKHLPINWRSYLYISACAIKIIALSTFRYEKTIKNETLKL